ncbi:MAG: portal protein, partial [Terriglobia bacterium]
MTFVLYGDAWVFIPWETEEVMDVTIENGKVKKTKRTLWDKPVLKVLHPKDIYINSWETHEQSAQRVGLRFDLDLQALEQRAVQKLYDADAVKTLRQRLTGQEEKVKELEKKLSAPGYYKEHEGRYYQRDVFEAKAREKAGLGDATPNALRMLKVFVREDLDGDGVCEEIVFDVEIESGIVPYARYANLEHRLRPLVHYFYNKRPNSIYNRGVGELLYNIAKILNTTIRDIFDNNKVQNTKMFLARKNSPIEEQMKVYPSRLIFVDNIETDFKAIDLGSGRPVTSVQDVSFMMTWGERLTGITDANLGQEKRSRTPATTQLSLLEEGSQRRDRSIDLMRSVMRDMWWQVLMLYFQNGDVTKLAEVAAISEADRALFLQAHAAVSVELFKAKVIVRPEVSSNSLNRGVQRQEALALMAVVQD